MGDVGTRQAAFQRGEEGDAAKRLRSWRHTQGEMLGLGGEGVFVSIEGRSSTLEEPSHVAAKATPHKAKLMMRAGPD